MLKLILVLLLGRVQRIAQNDRKIEFADAIAIDEQGVMFFMANRLNRFFQGLQDIIGGNGTNFHIWKQKLGMVKGVTYGEPVKEPLLGGNTFLGVVTDNISNYNNSLL